MIIEQQITFNRHALTTQINLKTLIFLKRKAYFIISQRSTNRPSVTLERNLKL